MRGRRLVGVAVLAAVVAAGCGGGAPASSPDRLPVVATLYPLAEFVQRIGGDRVAVRTLVPAGVEPHEYDPTPRDLAAVDRARVFVYNGAGFEPWIRRLLPELPARVIAVDASQGLARGGDPHVWLDPVLAQAQVEQIRAALARADPAGAGAYAAGARAWQAELEALHRRYAEVLGRCRRKEFITAHAAFGYLADRYGLTQVAISGVTPEAEPSPARLREVVEFVRARGIRVIYAERGENRRVVEAVAQETGARVGVLHPLEALTRTEQAQGRTYLGVMDDNLRALAEGLDCSR